MAVFGIDISKWQDGYPYAEATAEGVKFAIIRAGYGQTKDSSFETHYANAKSQGWGVGAYWHMYANTIVGAQAEARSFLSAIAGKQFDYPVYLDIEDSSIKNIGKGNLDAMVEAFCSIVESAGYYVGVYTNVDWYNNVISGASLNKKYDWWIAKWGSSAPTDIDFGIWQFGGETNLVRSNRVAGVTTDQNYAYKDYPNIIKNGGFNGYSKNSGSTPTTTETTYTVVKGDTLSGIASKYGTTYQALASYNGISDPNKIYIGQVIKIPTNSATSSTQYYTVESGDNLTKIANNYGTTVNQLVSWNNISNPDLIYVGQKLRVK